MENLNNILWVKKILGTKEISGIEKIRSAEQNSVFKIETDLGSYILKEGPNLAGEKDRLVWLEGKLPTPKVVGWQEQSGQDMLLMTCIEGDDLANLVRKIPTEKVVQILAQTLHMIHDTDISKCPFGEKTADSVFIHGDACLPNFILLGEQLNGIIDLGNAGIGTKETDLAAAVWSLNYNYGPELGVPFLETYGVPSPTEEYAEELILKYEGDWSERFKEEENGETRNEKKIRR